MIILIGGRVDREPKLYKFLSDFRRYIDEK